MERKGFRHRGLAHGDGADGLPGLQQLRTCRLMEHGIDAAADDRPGIRRIDDGIRFHFGDIIPKDLKGHNATPFPFVFGTIIAQPNGKSYP
jgi:hypothetical protein